MLVGVVTSLAVVFGPGLVSAQERESPAQGAPSIVREVNSIKPAEATVTVMHPSRPEDVSLRVDGRDVKVGEAVSLAQASGSDVGVVFVLDTSSPMDESGALQEARAAVEAIASDMPQHQWIGLVQAGDRARVVLDLSRNGERVARAVDRIAVSEQGGSRLQDALEVAARLFEDRPKLQANVVVVSAGTDRGGGEEAGSTVSTAAVRARLRGVGAAVFAVGSANAGYQTGLLQQIVDGPDGTGGRVLPASESPSDMARALRQVNGWLVEDQYVIPFVAPESSDAVRAELRLGETSLAFGFIPGRLERGPAALDPRLATPGGGVGFLKGTFGLYLGVAAAAVAVAALGYGLYLSVARDEGLSHVLRAYSEGFQQDVEGDGEGDATSLASSAIVQRAIELTEQVAESRGYLTRTEALLERANLPLRAGEALFFYLAIVVLATILAMAVTRSLIGGLVLGGIAAAVPPVIVGVIAGRRRAAFHQQLPDMLQVLAGTLRAGYSLLQGVDAVSHEIDEPMGRELRRVMAEARLGRDVEDALDDVAQRMSSPDFAWAVMAIRIQREVGGNLSELLLTVAETMVARERIRREVKALTAEGRMSAYVLVVLPIGLAGVMYVLNPDYITRLFDTTLGNVLLGLGALGIVVGYVWMQRIIKIDV